MGVFNVIMGGMFDVGIVGQVIVGQIDNIYVEMMFIEMDMSYSIFVDLDFMFIIVVIKNVFVEEFNFGNIVVYIFIIEQELIFFEFFGFIDEVDFYNVMCKMFFNVNGIFFGVIVVGDLIVLEFVVVFLDYIYDYSQFGVIGFV